MNTTPQQITAIRAFVAGLAGGWTKTDAQIRAAMAARQVANPVATAPMVGSPFAAIDAMALISKTSKAKLALLPSFASDVIPLLNTSLKTPETIGLLNAWAVFYFDAGAITQAEFDAVAAPAPGTTAGAAVGLFNATEADPSWTSTVPWDVANLGRPCDDFDIEIARSS